MTKPTRFLVLLAALAAAGTVAQAQPALRVVTVDLNRAYAEYWKTQQKMGNLLEQSNQAQEQIREFERRIEAVATEGKQLQADADNPMLTEEAKSKKIGEAQRKFQEFQEKQEQLRQYAENAQRALENDRRVFTELMLDEIKAAVTRIGKDRGATVIIDTSGRTTNGVSSIIYFDPAYDVTDAVITELNKSKPADFKAPAPAADGS